MLPSKAAPSAFSRQPCKISVPHALRRNNYHEDLIRHNEVEFLNSIHKLFYPKGQSFPKAHEWGVISTCAWGAMRAMDYLETDKDIDHQRVAVMGHSKMGKTALWTAAQDERFALAISAQSGCAGAALWRRKSGETLKKMVTRFPYWLCRNASKFVEQEDDLPVDQHMLLACIAPRPVYVHSGVKDTWADGRGEYLSAYHAGEVYRLLSQGGIGVLLVILSTRERREGRRHPISTPPPYSQFGGIYSHGRN